MNFRITNLLRWVTAFEVSVLVVSGLGLFLLPDILGMLWPWSLLPFNTRFLGAIYTASMISAAAIIVRPYWSPARILVPMIAIFTVTVLGVSVAYLSRFDGYLFSTVLWFALYIGIPLNAIYHLWLYREKEAAETVFWSSEMKTWLLAQGLILGIYGLALLIAPVNASAFWPWALDGFHGRMYSVAFTTPALGAFLLFRTGSKLELQVLGVTQLAGGILPIIGLMIVDMNVKRVDWSAFGAWVWIGLFVYIFVSGAFMIWKAMRLPSEELVGR